MPLRILHISDLHERAKFEGMPSWREPVLNRDSVERGLVLGDKYYDCLRALGKDRIDLVCFTGDIADWGHPEEYKKATERLAAILEVAGVARNRVFVVPGNHDVQRTVHRVAWKGVRDWYSRTGNATALGRWIVWGEGPPPGIQRKWRDAVLQRQAAFREWAREFGCAHFASPMNSSLGYRHTFPVGILPGVELPVHIIGLDSAWLCGGDDDQGRILVTEEQVLAHVRTGENDLEGLRIALIHHPLTELADHHGSWGLLAENVDIVLHGHQHKPLALRTSVPGARLKTLAAGCLMEGDLGKNWPNAFHLIELDSAGKSGTIHFRKWARDATPRFWAKGSDIYPDAPHGVMTWPLDERTTKPDTEVVVHGTSGILVPHVNASPPEDPHHAGCPDQAVNIPALRTDQIHSPTGLLDRLTVDWTRFDAQQLCRTLSTAMPSRELALPLVDSVDISHGAVNWTLPPELVWRSVIDIAAYGQVLRRLMENFLADSRFAGLHGQLDGILQAGEAPTWYPMLDRWLEEQERDTEARRVVASLLLRRLAELVDIRAILTESECDVLAASAHVMVSARMSGTPSPPNVRHFESALLPISGESLVTISERALLIYQNPVPERRWSGASPLRIDVLVELLRAGQILLLDRVGMPRSRPVTESSPVEDWAADSMMKLEVSRGLVSHTFGVGSAAYAVVLERWLLLTFTRWRMEACGPLGRARVSISMAYPKVELCRDYPVAPGSVVRRFKQAARDCGRLATMFGHLGEESAAPQPDLLIPLPIGTLGDAVVVPAPNAEKCPTEMVLVPYSRDGVHSTGTEVTLGAEDDRILLDPTRLRPGTDYRWTIRRDDGAGYSEIAQGETRTLTAAEAELWRAVFDVPEKRRGIAVAFGLFHSLLQEIWPRVGAGASQADLSLACVILADSYAWLREHAPGSPQVDSVRDLGGWLCDRFEPARLPPCDDDERGAA